MGILGFYSQTQTWVKSALKIIRNDTDMTNELLNFQIENRLFKFCVGKIVGGKSPEVSHVLSTEFLLNLDDS